MVVIEHLFLVAAEVASVAAGVGMLPSIWDAIPTLRVLRITWRFPEEGVHGGKGKTGASNK